MEKIVIFGVGNQYKMHKILLKSKYEIVAYLDNKIKEFEDGNCLRTESISDLEYDFMVITPVDYKPIYNQCLKLGIEKKKIVLLDLIPELYLKRSCGVEYYGQHYEDLIILAIFGYIGIDRPSYMDLGANHPYNISNTALMYRGGCRGINVDANTETINLFNIVRPDDCNINVGVAVKAGSMLFYKFSDTCGLNTFSKKDADNMSNTFGVNINEVVELPVVTLKMLIDEYCGGNFPDYLDCDIEGYDYDVLKSYNLSINGPKVLCVEVRTKEFLKFDMLMGDYDYFRFCKIGENSIYVKEEFRRILRIERED